MFDSIRALVLRWMRVPPAPEPPAGAPESIRVFRASGNLFKLRLLGWGLTQVAAVTGIVFWLIMLGILQRNVEETRRQILTEIAGRQAAPGGTASNAPAPMPASRAAAEGAPFTPTAAPLPAGDPKPAKKKSVRSNRNAEQIVRYVPVGIFFALKVLEVFGILGFLAQLPLTFAALRLDFELRWYIVTDRSLRIRSGIWRLQELTMSFANIQQVVVTRGPIQGLLKISDVRVQSAGGGGGGPAGARGRDDGLHTGIFHGVDNASEIRDLILDRLRRFRAAGLGDPDDAHETHAGVPPVCPLEPGSHSAVAAAQELLDEARALRAAL